jgi:CBS domain-containing protein
VRRITRCENHLDDQQTTGRTDRLADVTEDRQAFTVVPVVDDMRKDVGIGASGDMLKEIATRQ